jgi:O-antigen/teichoic acid export membrane protein
MTRSLSDWSFRLWRSSVLFSALAVGLRIGAHLILLPAILFYLTPADQALWWIFVALGNFGALVDFGFGQTISRAYNILWAGAERFEATGVQPIHEARAPNISGISNLHHTVQHLYRWLSIGAITAMALAGTFYLYKVLAPPKFTTSILLLWICFLLAIGFNFFTTYWAIACQGINRVREMQVAQVWSSSVFLIVVITSLVLGAGLAAMILGTIARTLVLLLIARRAFYRVIPRSGIRGKPDVTLLRKLWPNARRLGVLSITGYWAANGLVLMSGWFLDVPTTASVGATNMVGNVIVSFAGIWLAVKWPQITIYRTQGKMNELSALFARRLALSVATFLGVALAVSITGNWILEWKQSSTRLLPWPYLGVYLLYLLQQFIYVQFASLVFTENVVPFCKISILTGLAMVALSFILVPRYALWGLILSPLITEALFSAWIVVRRGFSSQSMGVQQFFRLAIFGRI